MQNHWSSIIVVEDVARIAVERRDAERAARLLGAAANLREEAGAAPLPPEREAIDRLTTSVRDALGPVAFVATFQAGQALTLTQALDLAKTLMAEPSRAEATPRAGVPRLVVTALGRLEVAIDGTALQPSAWRSLESRDLLL